MSNALDSLLPQAQEALAAFLQQLTGLDATLSVRPPERSDVPVVPKDSVVLHSGPAGAPNYTVALGRGWADLLATAMLGEPVSPEEAPDLVGEAVGQAYGALRSHFGAAGTALPDLSFAPGTAESLDGPIWQIAFTLPTPEATLKGVVLMPTLPEPPRAAPEASVHVAPAAFDDLGAESIGDGATDLHVLSDVELELTVELGRRHLPLADVLRLTTGSVVELDKMVGQPLFIYANGRMIAEGEAVVIDDQFGVRVTSLSTPTRRRSALV